MRIASVFEWKVNAFYRAMGPLDELRRRGHDVEYANTDDDPDRGVFDQRALRGADLLHCYRIPPIDQQQVVLARARSGMPLVWDTDDDLSAVPKESPDYHAIGGRTGRRIFARTVELARAADVVTVSTPALADRYRAEGIERIEVLGNYLPTRAVRASRLRHSGVVIGWVAGLEHGSELSRIPIADALARLADATPQLRIQTVGLDLRLATDRYTRIEGCDWHRLQEHIGRWDIGIAPLADIPFNRTRSPVKLKEYASVGIPWLASPIGPYIGLGEREGGRLVEDHGWHAALERLVQRPLERRRLRRRAKAWARTQTIERHAARWEAVCEEATERAAVRAKRQRGGGR